MRGMKRLGAALIAACALSVVTAAIASAHLFESTGVGALTVNRNQTQVFKTKPGNVECTKILLDAEAALSALSQHVTALYEGCTAIGVSATVSPALYVFLADDAKVHIVNTITIKALGCAMTVKPQSVGTVLYINTGKTLELKPEVEGIAYEGTGTICTGKGTDGTYTGTSVVEVAGQTVKWS